MTNPTTPDTDAVVRYDITGYDWGEEPCESGDYVRHSDYAALAAENAKLKAVAEQYRHNSNEQFHRANKAEAANARIERLEEAMKSIAAKVNWEINPSNYNHDDVCGLNSDWIEVGSIAEAALETTAVKEGGDGWNE